MLVIQVVGIIVVFKLVTALFDLIDRKVEDKNLFRQVKRKKKRKEYDEYYDLTEEDEDE